MQQITTDFRNRRMRLGLTLEDLAQRCTDEGVSVDDSTLSRIERGRQRPRPRLRPVLARVLGLDIAYFEQITPAAKNAKPEAGAA